MNVICAWCHKVLKAEKVGREVADVATSHGICATCKAEFEKDIERSKR